MERIWLLAKIEFKLRYYENKLGLLWAVIKPISDIFIYYVAFELVLKQGIPNFVSFLFIAPVSYTHLDVYKRQHLVNRHDAGIDQHPHWAILGSSQSRFTAVLAATQRTTRRPIMASKYLGGAP